MKDYLSTREAAASLKIPYGTLMGWIYKGKVPAERKGWCWYVRADEIEALRGRMAA